MLILRLAQHAETQPDHYRVDIRLEGGDMPQTPTAKFQFKLTGQDQEDLRWYLEDYLELHDERDRQGRAQCLGQLGLVAYERFKEARAATPTPSPRLRAAGKTSAGEGSAYSPASGEGGELLKHLNDALGSYQQALALLPPNAVDDLAVTHNQLGNIYKNADDLDHALPHYREAIRYSELGGDLYEAAKYRSNVALALMQARRLDDAGEYARAALRNYETYGERAAEEIQKTKGLIEGIESLNH